MKRLTQRSIGIDSYEIIAVSHWMASIILSDFVRFIWFLSIHIVVQYKHVNSNNNNIICIESTGFDPACVLCNCLFLTHAESIRRSLDSYSIHISHMNFTYFKWNGIITRVIKMWMHDNEMSNERWSFINGIINVINQYRYLK